MNVTLRQLRAFVLVAESGSYIAASRRMHLTQSALSLLVKELETVVGVRLLDRTTRQTSLSAAGAEFFPLARKLLDDLESALHSTRELREKQRGTVRIACTPLYAAMLLPKLSSLYRERFPAIRLHLLDSLNQAALARVVSGEADLGIAPQRPSPPELMQESLSKDRICLICPPDHPLARLRRVTWAQVLREPFVTLTSDFSARLQADLYRHSPSLALEPAHEVSFVTTALGMVQAGYGITAQPAHALPMLATYSLVSRPIVQPVVHRQLSLFTRRGYSLSPAAASFREFLLAWGAGQ
ncbi:MAG: LysR family transcriptional regulator [Burkholderiales bacterium]|nr:LysR family transcriptional regulator [Burkholderiales bacterium]